MILSFYQSKPITLTRHFFPLLCLIFSIQLNAQVDKSNYELLWEVSGKDLPQASYLFGTMHVRDVRAFEFSDSVMLMLDHCDQFAMEVHPDTLTDFLLDLYLNGDTTNVLKDMLSEAAYQSLNEAMLRKTGKPIDSLDVKDPFYIELLLTDFDEPEHTKKNPQFVDLYLYKQALAQGDGIYGLEKISDYLSLTSSFFNLFEKEAYQDLEDAEDSWRDGLFESFLEVYQSGDLNRLTGFLDQFPEDEDYNYEMLIRRNYNMTDQFLNLAKKQSTFCAVGAAHLPAKEGMLDLLRKKGYQVRRVLPIFTGVAEKYAEMELETPWHVHKNTNLAYEVATPGLPYKMLSEEAGDLFDLYIRSDLTEMSNFIFMSVRAAPDVDLSAESYSDTVLQRWNEETPMEVLNREPTKRDGQEGTRYWCQDEEGSKYIFEIFIRARMIHLFAALREDEQLDTRNIQRYFESIRFLEVPKNNQSYTLTEKAGAFEIQLPARAKHRWIKKNVDYSNGMNGEVHLHSYISVDPVDEYSYLVRYNNYSSGIVIRDPEDILTSSVNTFKALWQNETAVAKDVELDGYPGKDILIDRGEAWVYLRHILRGNRLYLMMAAVPPNVDFSVVAPVFESFKFLPLNYSPLSAQKSASGRFQIGMPNNVEVEIEKQSYYRVQDVQWSAQDTLSGTLFELNEYEYSPYLSQNRFDTIQTNSFNNLQKMEEQVSNETIQFQGSPALYMLTDDNVKDLPTHRLLFFRDRFLYELMVFPTEPISRAKIFEYYNTFQYLKSAEALPENGATLLFDDLASSDTTKQNLAKETVNHFYFDASNLPDIYRILELDFPADTLGERTIHEMMLREFTYNKDEGTLPFLVALFKKKNHDPKLQESILQTLAEMQNKAAYAQFFELAKNFKKEEYSGYVYKNIFSPFLDSLSLTAEFIPQILELDQSKAFEYYSYYLLFNLLRNDHVDLSQTPLPPQRFLDRANQLLEQEQLLTAEKATYFDQYYHLDALHVILGELTLTNATESYFAKAQSMVNPYLLSTIVDNLMMKKLPVERSTFEKVMESPYAWYRLLNNSSSEQTVDQIPADLLRPASVVEAYVAYEVEQEYNRVKEYKLLETKDYQDSEQAYKLYFFQFEIRGYSGTYIGVCSQPSDENACLLYTSPSPRDRTRSRMPSSA